MSDHPPPYIPHPSAPGFTSAYTTQPSSFPGSPYQTFPQSYTGGEDHYHGPYGPYGPHGPLGHQGPYHNQPSYHGYQSGGPGTSHHWDGQPKQTVFVVEQRQEEEDGGAADSCLAACSAIMCCCCLFDMFEHFHHDDDI